MVINDLNGFSHNLFKERVLIKFLVVFFGVAMVAAVYERIYLISIKNHTVFSMIELFFPIIIGTGVLVFLILWSHYKGIRHKQLINVYKEIGDFHVLKTIKGYYYLGKECEFLAISENGDLFKVECRESGEVETQFLTEKLSLKSK